MDPNEALRLAREAAAELANCEPTPGSNEEQLVDAFNALDQWLSDGGFLPARWAPAAARAGDAELPSRR